MRCSKMFAVLLVWAFLSSVAWAQETTVSLEAYKLGPGDVLRVEVFGEKDLSGTFRIGPSGSIVLPQVGAVDISGLTLAQAQERIREALSELLRRPMVGVSIDELASARKVYVGGKVSSPGPRELPFGATVLDAIIAAGIRPDSDLRHVRLTRPGQAPRILDLSGWKTAKGVDISVPLRWGDIIFVPELTERISILGAVAQPVTLVPAIGERITVLEAIARAAGGLTEEADPANATLLHADGTSTHLDIRRLLEEGDVSQNVELKPGDVLIVPKAKSVSVVGEVEQPVSFIASEPVPVLEALARAGALQPQADLKHARIIRPSGVEEVDLDALVKEGRRVGEVKLNPGDVLVIPEAPPEEILLAGAVTKPGPVDIRQVQKRDILRILTAVGLTEAADGTRVCVFRGDQQIIVNYKRILEQGDLKKNMDLQPGDLVYVPSLDKIYVLGAVGSGGRAIPCPDEGVKLLDALVRAGGLGQSADPNNIHIVRPRPDGTTEHVQVRLGDVKKGRVPPAIVLKPGDIVYVGARKRPFSLSQLRTLLWTVTLLRNVF